MNTDKLFLPFEMKPCAEHGWACGGDAHPRYDLPVFRESTKIADWMTDPKNASVHKRKGEFVRLQWMEHTPEEATNLGFNVPPQENLH